MENKTLGIVLVVVCVVLIGFSILWTKAPEKELVVKPTPTTVVNPAVGTLPSDMPLSKFQITACNAADRGGTCENKLPRLGLVSTGDCCKYLGKCC